MRVQLNRTLPPASCVRVLTCMLVSPRRSVIGGQNIFSHAGTRSLHLALGRQTSLLVPSRVLPLLHQNSTWVFRMLWLVDTSRPWVGMMMGQVKLSTMICLTLKSGISPQSICVSVQLVNVLLACLYSWAGERRPEDTEKKRGVSLS